MCVCVCVCERQLAPWAFPAGEAARRVLAGSSLRAPALPTRGCRPLRAPQAVPRAGSAAAPHPGHRYLPASFLTTVRRTPRAPRHATAGHLTLPAAAAPPPSRPIGALGWRWEPLGVRLIPPCPVYLGGQAAGAAGSRRRCEQEARGGSAAALHGGSSPALRLGGSGAAPRAAGRPVAATSAGATPVHGAPPSAFGPGSAAPQSLAGRAAPPGLENPSAGGRRSQARSLRRLPLAGTRCSRPTRELRRAGAEASPPRYGEACSSPKP